MPLIDQSSVGIGSSQRGARYGLLVLREGVYKHRSGRLIVRTYDVYEGPRGGAYNGWETARYDTDGTIVIDSWTVFRTLREAAADLDREAAKA